MINIEWPQFFVLAWVIFYLVLSSVLDGQDRPAYNFADSIIYAFGLLWFLFWGGFFS